MPEAINTKLIEGAREAAHPLTLLPECAASHRHTQTAKGKLMKERRLTIPEIMLIGGTRVALGAGVGLLLANKLNNDQRKAAGLSLLIVGALTTIPLVINVLAKTE